MVKLGSGLFRIFWRPLYRKARTFLYLVTHSHFSLILHKLLFNRSNALPFPQRYKYIAIGSHGVGLSSLCALLHHLDFSRQYVPGDYYLLCHDPNSPYADSIDPNLILEVPIIPLRFDLNTLAKQKGPFEIIWFKAPFYFPFMMWRNHPLVESCPRSHAHADSFRILRNMRKRVPVIWLVRDPLESICSCINLAYAATNRDLAHIISGILANTSDAIDFLDIYDQVKHLQAGLHIFDVSDISTPDRVRDTMRHIAGVLRATYVDFGTNFMYGNLVIRTFPMRIRTKYKDTFIMVGPFSSVKNRDYEYRDLYVNIKSKNPECLSIDFCESKIFVNKLIRVGGDLMCVAVTGRHRRRLSRELEENAGMLMEVRVAALKHCEIMEAVIAQRNRGKLSPEALIDHLKSNDHIALSLYRSVRPRIGLIQGMRPDIVERWTYFGEFISYVEDRFFSGSRGGADSSSLSNFDNGGGGGSSVGIRAVFVSSIALPRLISCDRDPLGTAA